MRVVIATTQTPFVRGGAEMQAEGLCAALVAAGHEAEIVAVPFRWEAPARILDHMLVCRLLDLASTCGAATDLLIGLKFPAYLVPHPNRRLWLVPQHPTAYNLWEHEICDLTRYPDGPAVRRAIHDADRTVLAEARSVFTCQFRTGAALRQFAADRLPTVRALASG